MTDPMTFFSLSRAATRSWYRPTGSSMRFSTRTPVCSTRLLLSGRRFKVSESFRAPKIFDLLSTAMNEMSTLLFVPRLQSRPFISMPTTTEALGCGPLNGAANTRIVNPLTCSGLFDRLEHLGRHPAGLGGFGAACPWASRSRGANGP